jgi:hypothetical protein
MEMKKIRVTQVLLILLAIMMAALTGCGSDIGADNPNLGVYKAKSAEMSGFKVSVEEVFEDGFIIELKKKGKAHLEADGEDGGNIKWTLDGDKFHAEGGGAVLDGTLSDGVMVLENVMDSGMTLYLECDAIVAGAGKGDDGKATLKGKKGTLEDEDETTGEEESTDEDDPLYGRYEAVSAEDSDGEVWIEEGEYLIVNEDNTVSMYVAEQDLDFDTTIENNKFYLDGDTKVGEINDDGSITLNLSDEVKYTFAKEGSDLWKEWQEVMGVDDTEPVDGSVSGKIGSLLGSDESDAGKYEIYIVTQNGKVYMQDELAAKGIEAWIEMNPDGTGRINLVGDIMDMEWGDGKIYVPENSEGGSDEYRYSFANEYLVLVDEDMTLSFIKVSNP